MHTNKMLCIKYLNGLHVRLLKHIADMEVQEGKAKYTSKSALYHFWKMQRKLQVNDLALKSFDFSNNQEINFLHKEEDNGKTYAYLKRGEKQSIEPVSPKEKTRKPKWWEKALETITFGVFKPTLVTLEGGKLQIVSYPVYQRFLVGVTN